MILSTYMCVNWMGKALNMWPSGMYDLMHDWNSAWQKVNPAHCDQERNYTCHFLNLIISQGDLHDSIQFLIESGGQIEHLAVTHESLS